MCLFPPSSLPPSLPLMQAVLLEDLSCYWLQFIIIFIVSWTFLCFLEEFWLGIHSCVKRIYPNWRPSGKQVVLLWHTTTGQKWNQRTETKVRKSRCELSPSYYSHLWKIIMVRKTHYYHLNYHCRLIKCTFILHCFQSGKALNCIFIFSHLKIIHVFQI